MVLEDVTIIRLKKGDLNLFIELIYLFEDVFEMKDFSIPDSGHLQKVLDRDDFYVFVALHKDKVVGGLTTYVLEQYYATRPLAYIYDLAVDASLQRRGIGKRLMAATTAFYREKGFEEVFVQADKIDAHAVDFYRSTGPTQEEEVVHFYYVLSAAK